MGGIEAAQAMESEVEAMDARLKIWGHWCRCGSQNIQLWESDTRSGRSLTTYQVRDANKLQLIIMRLPILHRMVCQVHYVDLGDNEEIGKRRKWEEVNARLKRAGEYRRISRGAYPHVHGRALKIIINSERIMQF